MTASQTASASPKTAPGAAVARAASAQDAAPQAEASGTQPSRAHRLLALLKRVVGAVLAIRRRIVARARALLPGTNKSVAETAADAAGADAHEERREPVLADEAALAAMQGPAGDARKEAKRAHVDATSAPADSAPEPAPNPVRRLTVGHAYAALAGLILGAIIGAGLFWNLAVVQTKRMHRAYAASEAAAEEVSRLSEELAAAEQKLADANKPQEPARHAVTPARPVSAPTGPDASCELSGKRGEMIEELRSCLKEFTRYSR